MKASQSCRLILSIVTCVLLVGGVARADVFVITPGMTTGDVQAVIDGAVDGDILLIESGGSFGSLGIDKGITLIGDGPTRPEIDRVSVSGVPSGSVAVLRGLLLRPPSSTPFSAIFVGNNEGCVLIEDCLVPASDPYPAEAALSVLNSHAVSVTNSELHGGMGAPDNFPPQCAGMGRPAISADRSHVTVSESILEGGTGGLSEFCAAPQGGRAVDMDGLPSGSHVILSGCSLQGGDGGTGFGGTVGADGNALFTGEYPLSVVWLVDSTLTGGVTGAGTVVDFAGTTARSLAISAPVRDNEAGAIDFIGKSGDMIGLFASFETQWLPLFGTKNAFFLGAPHLGAFILGPNPAGHGAPWVIPFTAPDLMGLPGLTLVVQALVEEPSTFELVLTGTTTYVQVDDTF